MSISTHLSPETSRSTTRRNPDDKPDMDLTAGVIGLKQAELTSRVQYAVARKILDNQQLQGDAAIKLIEAAGETLQPSADVLTAAATGLGARIDTYG